jgi:hypothetical protein
VIYVIDINTKQRQGRNALPQVWTEASWTADVIRAEAERIAKSEENIYQNKERVLVS